jgi:hypothetical protein
VKDVLRVVTLGTDAIDSATYGGEQRSERLNRIFRDHAEEWGIDSTYLCDKHFMTYFRPAKPRPPMIVRRMRDLWHAAPPDLALVLGNRPKAASELERKIGHYRKLVEGAQLVQFEHPFAYPFFEDRLEGKAVVYSSHNVESQILADYFQRIRPEANELRRLEARILHWENRLVRRADLVIACTERDARHYREIGARQVCLARNGARRLPRLDDPALAKIPFDRYVLYVSSAWRPNVVGLLEHCSGLALREGRGVVCVGGIEDSIDPDIHSLRANPSFHFTGVVGEDRLAAIASGATAFIVPMLDAGGSNTKTAQALLSRKSLIATPDALRGFEAFERSPGVHVRTTPQAFIAEIVRQLESEEREYERPETDALRWSSTLVPAVDALKTLVEPRRRGPRDPARAPHSGRMADASMGWDERRDRRSTFTP